MAEPAVVTTLTQVIAMAATALPASVKTAGVWGLLAVFVALMLFSLVTHVFQRTSSFLLWHTWPALLLLLLQAMGIVPPPPAFLWTWAVDETIIPQESAIAFAWPTGWRGWTG